MNDQPTRQTSIRPANDANRRDDRASMEAVLALAKKLDRLTPADRATALVNLSVEMTEWSRLLNALFATASETTKGRDLPDARTLLSHARAPGLSWSDALQIVAALIPCESLRAHWANWTQSIDREELRLRLEILALSQEWHEDFAPFVTFFFRASVADLYQSAAIALGRHLHQSQKLREYLANYSSQRSVPIDRAVDLNGGRTARRMMLALAAAQANPPAEPAITNEPVPIETGDDGQARYKLPQSAADLATALLAIDVLVTGRPNHDELIRRTRDALARVSQIDSSQLSRASVQRFGGLLARCGGDETDSNWLRQFNSHLHELRGLSEGQFGRRVAAMFRLDELLHCASILPEPWPQRIAQHIAEIPNSLERRFVLIRVLTWAQREGRQLQPWTDLLDGIGNSLHHAVGGRLSPSAALTHLEQAVIASSSSAEPLFATATTGMEIELLDRFLCEMDDSPAWLSHEEPERAMFAMLLIDLAQHTQAPTDQVNALLARHGLTVADSHAAAHSAGAVATSVILRLLTWEKPGAEDLIDVRMLHRIDDIRVLLALIPTGQRSPLLPALADAIEHQIRWRLRHEDEFSPDVLLALTQVRQPHPQLYQALSALCEGRTYRRSDGSEVAIPALVKHACDESERALDEALSTAPPADTAYAKSLSRLRERLRAALQPSGDLRLRIEALLAVIGEAVDGSAARSGTMIDVLHVMYDPDEPLLQDGFPAWSKQTLSVFLRELDGDLVRVSAMAHSLLPRDWSSSDESREAATNLRSILDRRLNELARSLPAVEAAALRDLHIQLHAEITAWIATIESVIDQWPESALRSGAEGVNYHAAHLTIASIGRIEHALLRGHLLGLLWRSLCAWVTLSSLDEGETWALKRRLLDEAIEQSLAGEVSSPLAAARAESDAAHWSDADRGRANSGLLALWSELAEQAMERNEECRVVELAIDARFATLRRQSAAAEMLRSIRKWCHDRYLLRTAASVRNDLHADGGNNSRSFLSVASEIGPFLGNFPTIWLAMLIGAIFMLDFGDAWSDMADPDVADIRGIAITFLIGIGGAFGYIFWNLKQKSRLAPGEPSGALRRSQLLRAGLFSALCLIYTLVLVTGLWWLLYETDAVVKGVWAIGHIVVWSGFALFVGVFFGLLAGDA